MAASRLQQPDHRSDEERSLRQDIDEMFSNLGHLADIGSLQVPTVHKESFHFSFPVPLTAPLPQGKHGELERYIDPVKPSPPPDDYYDHLMEAGDDQRLDLLAQRPDHGRDPASQQLQQLRPASDPPPHLKQQQQLPEMIGEQGPAAASAAGHFSPTQRPATQQQDSPRQQQQHAIKQEFPQQLVEPLEGAVSMADVGDRDPSGDDSPVKEEGRRLKDDKRPMSDCHVCGDRAIAHMHYGGICCYSCKVGLLLPSYPSHCCSYSPPYCFPPCCSYLPCLSS